MIPSSGFLLKAVAATQSLPERVWVVSRFRKHLNQMRPASHKRSSIHQHSPLRISTLSKIKSNYATIDFAPS